MKSLSKLVEAFGTSEMSKASAELSYIKFSKESPETLKAMLDAAKSDAIRYAYIEGYFAGKRAEME